MVAICRAVDGLPLAIEMATGHLRTLPPALLRSRLNERLGLDRQRRPRRAGAAADHPGDHRLEPAAARATTSSELFRRLGIFNGPVALEAVEQVCDGGFGDVVDPLTRLVEQSLVRRVVNSRHEPRYVLLELVRERARDLLGDEPTSWPTRHATYVVTFLEDLDERRWTDAADRWIDDITELLGEVRAGARVGAASTAGRRARRPDRRDASAPTGTSTATTPRAGAGSSRRSPPRSSSTSRPGPVCTWPAGS